MGQEEPTRLIQKAKDGLEKAQQGWKVDKRLLSSGETTGEDLRIKWLGRKKGLIQQLHKSAVAVPMPDRKELAKQVNELRGDVESELKEPRAASPLASGSLRRG